MELVESFFGKKKDLDGKAFKVLDVTVDEITTCKLSARLRRY